MDEDHARRQRHYPRDFDGPDTDSPFEVDPQVVVPQTWVNKTSKGFTGGVASGRGVNITAEDDVFTITADRDLPQAKLDLATAAGFDDKSAVGFTILEGEKRKIRESGGDINKISRAMIEPDELWTSKAEVSRTGQQREGR